MSFEKVEKALKCTKLSDRYLQNFIDHNVTDSATDFFRLPDELEQVISNPRHRIQFLSVYQKITALYPPLCATIKDFRKNSNNTENAIPTPSTSRSQNHQVSSVVFLDSTSANNNSLHESASSSTAKIAVIPTVASEKAKLVDAGLLPPDASFCIESKESWKKKKLKCLTLAARTLFKQEMLLDVLHLCTAICPLENCIFGPSHPKTLRTLQMKAGCLVSLKKYQEALDISRFVYKQRTELLGPNNQDTLHAQRSVAQALVKLGQCQDAMPMLEEVYEIQQLLPDLGPDHSETLKTLVQLAHCVGRLSDWERCQELYAIAFEKRIQISGLFNRYTLEAQKGYELALTMLGRHREAWESYRRIYVNANAAISSSSHS